VCLLLDHGVANLEAESKDGRRPLHLAPSSGGTEIVRLLLDRGASGYAKERRHGMKDPTPDGINKCQWKERDLGERVP
jgi:ankyrin repeat protein